MARKHLVLSLTATEAAWLGEALRSWQEGHEESSLSGRPHPAISRIQRKMGDEPGGA